MRVRLVVLPQIGKRLSPPTERLQEESQRQPWARLVASTIPQNVLAKGAFWTFASFGAGQIIRFSTNVALTRLLAPDLFGIMVIVNTMKTGIELLSDVGIGQSIVYNKNSEDPDFHNTAWTLQCIRGALLWIVACAISLPVAHFYKTPDLLTIIPVASLVLVLGGLTSISPFLVQKRLQIDKLTVYEIASGALWALGQIALAYVIPTIWSMVLGLIFGAITATIGSFFLIPELRLRFTLSRAYTRQILHFGKWVFLGSVVYFLAISFDRLYLAGVIPFALLGVYGISRSISELLSLLAGRLCNLVVFPFIASRSHIPRKELRSLVVSIRHKFLTIAALGFSFSAATVDFPIKLIFDERYHAAAWMVPVLIVGAWASILCSLNESILLGVGKPRYNAIGYAFKFGFLLVGLPVGFTYFGVLGCITMVAASDAPRYLAILSGQSREQLSFAQQDLFGTLLMLALIAVFEMSRWASGFGTSFGSLWNIWPSIVTMDWN
jgi:O-antigen/teichoic acid export membrane protein